MATLRCVATLIVMGTLMCAHAIADEPSHAESLPASQPATQCAGPMLDDAPLSGLYWVWWRPYSIVLDDETVSRIRARCDAIDADNVATVSLNEAFGTDVRSAFLFVVLSQEGEKGRILLERVLQKYSGGKRLDNRWLLIIAALGRNSDGKSVETLRTELHRFRKEYPPSHPQSAAFSFLDPCRPLLEAIIVQQVAHNKLTVDELQKYERGFGQEKLPVWLMGFEWTRYLANERLEKLLLASVQSCSDEELRHALDRAGAVPRLVNVQSYLRGRRSLWPVAKRLAIVEHDRKAVNTFWKTMYAMVLVSEADVSRSQYTISRSVAEAYTAASPEANRTLSEQAAILTKCKASQTIVGWQQLLRGHAASLDAKDKEFVEYFVTRVKSIGDEPGRPTYEDPPKHVVNAKGVHMLGFEAGRMLRHNNGGGAACEQR